MNDVIEPAPQHTTKVEVIYAGGTISSLATPQGYREGGHVVDLLGRLSERYPGFNQGYALGEPEVAYTGLSENIDIDYWLKIKAGVVKALNNNPNAVIITHGTDSMEQTARYLQHELADLLKQKKTKVILTGANEDLSHPQTDAWDNLRFAFDSANSGQPEGVFVAFHEKLIPADLVVKEPYNGTEMNYTSSSDQDYIQKMRLQAQKNQQLIAKLRKVLGQNGNEIGVLEYEVNVVRANHDDFVEGLNGRGVKAVLLNLYHSGTANTDKPGLSVSVLVSRLREQQGIVFFGVTDNGEPVNLHSYETSVRLREAGVVPLYNMPREVAFAKLRLVANDDSSKMISAMLKSEVGEIDEAKIIQQDIDQLLRLYAHSQSSRS